MTWVAPLFPAAVETGELAPQAADETLLDPRERARVAGAVTKRRLQYAAGRLAARRALGRLGIEAFPLVSGDDRIPIWPLGIVGSISHTDDYCAVAVARLGEIVSVGLDVEVATDLGSNLWRTVLLPAEQAWIEATVPAADRGLVAKLFFSAKESVFKCQYPVTRRWLEFTDVEIIPDLDGETFEAVVAGDPRGLGIVGVEVDARLRIDARWVATAITLERSARG